MSIETRYLCPSRCAGLFVIALLIGLPLNGGAVATELGEFKAAIRAKYDMKDAAFAANDPEPILTRFYAEDVISTDMEGVTHIGRDALRPVYEEVIGGNVRIESFDTFVAGDAGWDWVNFHVSPPPEAGMEPFTFKMLFLWQRIDGEWWSRGEMYVMGAFDIDAPYAGGN
jgi:ketosteroid isomerase-like protein